MRKTMVYDPETGEIVTKDERLRRREARAAVNGRDRKNFTLPQRVERGAWVFDRAAGDLVPRDAYYAAKAAARHGDGPMIIGDDLRAGVNGLRHPATGKSTDSKSDFRRMTKEAGCVETGGFAPTGDRISLPSIVDDLRAARDRARG